MRRPSLWSPIYWRYRRIVTGYPRLTLLALAVVTVVFATRLTLLDRNTSPYILAEHHSTRVNHRHLMSTFTGTREMGVIGVVRDGSIFRPDTLSRVAVLTRRLADMQLVTDEYRNLLRERLERWPGPAAQLARNALANGLTPADAQALVTVREILQKEGVFQREIRGRLQRILGVKIKSDEELVNQLITRVDPVREVTSLATVENIVAAADGLNVSPVMRTPPTTQTEADTLRKAVMANPLLVNGIISNDERATVIRVEFNIEPSDNDALIDAYDRMRQEINHLKKDLPPALNEYYPLSGTPAVAATMDRFMQQDTTRLFPVLVVLCMLFLFVMVRTLRGVLLPVVNAVVTLVWTLGALSWFHLPIDNIATLLPIFIVTVAMVNAIHFVVEQRTHHLRLGLSGILTEEIEDHEGRRRISTTPKASSIRLTCDYLVKPMVVAGITAAAGFALLAMTDTPAIRHFGRFVALGILNSCAVTLLLAPAVLSLGDDRALSEERRTWGRTARREKQGSLDTLLDNLGRLTVRRSGEFLVLLGILTGLGLVSAWTVKKENRFFSTFARDSELRRDTELLNQHLGGMVPLNVIFTAPTDNRFQQPSVLRALGHIEADVQREVEVGYTLSLAGFVRHMNQVMHNENAAYNRVPNDTETEYEPKIDRVEEEIAAKPGQLAGRRIIEKMSMQPLSVPGEQLVAQYLLLYENSGGQDIRDVADSRYRQANMTILLRSGRSTTAERIMRLVRSLSDKHLGRDFEVRFSGSAEIASATTLSVVRDANRAAWWAALAMLVILLIAYQSLFIPLVALIPTVFSIIMNLAVLSLFRIPLNVGTTVLVSLGVGVGVHVGVHVMSRFREEAGGKNLADAMRATMAYTGKAILITLLVVAQGFSVFTLSSFSAVTYMGLLVALTVVWSALAGLIILPSFLVRFPVIRSAEVTHENVGKIS